MLSFSTFLAKKIEPQIDSLVDIKFRSHRQMFLFGPTFLTRRSIFNVSPDISGLGVVEPVNPHSLYRALITGSVETRNAEGRRRGKPTYLSSRSPSSCELCITETTIVDIFINGSERKQTVWLMHVRRFWLQARGWWNEQLLFVSAPHSVNGYCYYPLYSRKGGQTIRGGYVFKRIKSGS